LLDCAICVAQYCNQLFDGKPTLTDCESHIGASARAEHFNCHPCRFCWALGILDLLYEKPKRLFCIGYAFTRHATKPY
jgi:hypothetical protein